MKEIFENNLLVINDNKCLKDILLLNEVTSKKGLVLEEKQILELINYKNDILKEKGRIEIIPILDKIIYEFYNSPYVDEENYLLIIEQLTETFYLYQEEFDNKLTDEEIIRYLKENFNNNCAGSVTLLENDAMEELKHFLLSGEHYE